MLQAKGLLDAALVGAVLKLAEPNTRVRDESTNTLIFLAGLPGAAQSTTAFIIHVGARAHRLVYSDRVQLALFVCRGGLCVGGAGCFETAEAAGESGGGWHAHLKCAAHLACAVGTGGASDAAAAALLGSKTSRPYSRV